MAFLDDIIIRDFNYDYEIVIFYCIIKLLNKVKYKRNIKYVEEK